MPRQTKRPTVYLTLSPSALATAFCIAPRHVYHAILLGHLVVRQLPGTMARRIWIGDAEKWFRTYWLPAKPKRIKEITK